MPTFLIDEVKSSIDSGNGMVPSKQKAITWANVDPDLCNHEHDEYRLGANHGYSRLLFTNEYGSGREDAAVLLPGFAIIW